MKSLTLSQLQQYVKETTARRGFDKESIEEKMILFVEEIGELARAIRKQKNIKMSADTKQANLAEELADCLFYLLDIANNLGIDLETAFKNKEEKNKKRYE